MLEFLFDLLFEIIVEGSIALYSEKKVPMPLRCIAFIVVFLIFIGMTGLFLFLGYEAYIESDYGVTFVSITIGMFILFTGIYQTRKMLKNRD